MRWKRFIHNTLIFSMIFYACFLGKGENFACAQKRVRSLSKRVATATRTRGKTTSSSRRFVVKGRRSVSDVARRLTSLPTESNELFDVTTDFAGKSRTRTGLTATEAANFIVEERNKVVQGEDSQTASASGLSTTQNTQNAVFDNIIAPRTPTRLETREQAAARTPTRLETKERAPARTSTSLETKERAAEKEEAEKRETKERAAEKEEAEKEEEKKLPSSVGALMKFESFSFAERSGFKFGTTFGYEYEEDKILVGVLLPYDFVKSNDANLEFHRIGPVPYANYAILTEGPDPLTLRLGAFASLIGVMNTETSAGINTLTVSGGPSISAKKAFKAVIVKGLIENVITTFGFSFSFSGNNQKDSKIETSIKTGLNVGVPIGDNYVANVYTSYNNQLEPDSLDSDYYILGGEFSVYFTKLISATAGIKTVLGLDDFTSYEGHLGAILKF